MSGQHDAPKDSTPPWVKELWDRFAQSSLVSGAWQGMPWEDLPPEEQRHFITFVAPVDKLTRAIGDAAAWLRGPLRADTLNNAINALNRVLSNDEKVPEVAWGVASLEGLQRAVRNLCHLVNDHEWALLLTNKLGQPLKGSVGPEGVKRQPNGGIRYPAAEPRDRSSV